MDHYNRLLERKYYTSKEDKLAREHLRANYSRSSRKHELCKLLLEENYTQTVLDNSSTYQAPRRNRHVHNGNGWTLSVITLPSSENSAVPTRSLHGKCPGFEVYTTTTNDAPCEILVSTYDSNNIHPQYPELLPKIKRFVETVVGTKLRQEQDEHSTYWINETQVAVKPEQDHYGTVASLLEYFSQPIFDFRQNK